ncbi:hypothetical protein UNDKW_3670 [Undibacterium sp. KW1]|uniref:hypothetical protein n=1 Tax=Undibacterium sp. KW1 TaxID=2058624 RepID=UPI001331F68C|nr:hypothetical protein [Undibacterium sp. KW1]BBB61943.1 hypothetical protein UNDKW_3670 [Undibacterium sp. KW1]
MGGVHAEGGDIEVVAYSHGTGDFATGGGVVIEDEGVELPCQAQVCTGEYGWGNAVALNFPVKSPQKKFPIALATENDSHL